ncbi:hypothetical protein LTR86_001052 [Recurvomyces mirabilis]|nr:hypothetical protein LTR86_001052 [Recurvomyces mirabilis]
MGLEESQCTEAGFEYQNLAQAIMQYDWDAGGRFNDFNYYTHANLFDDYDPVQDSNAYYWDDAFMQPTGIFPHDNGQRIEHYKPFGALDFRPGGDQEYHVWPSHFSVDDQERLHDWPYDNAENDWANSRDVPWEDNMRWSHRPGSRGGGPQVFTNDDPYADRNRGGHWMPPRGGKFGFFDPREHDRYERRNAARPRDELMGLPMNYYLDRGDYVGGNHWFQPLSNGGSQPLFYRDEIRSIREMTDAEYDEWPEY